MNTKKYWLKDDPNITAQVFVDFETDDEGGIPAQVSQTGEDGNERLLYALIRLDDWSERELHVAPEGTAEQGYLVIYGEDNFSKMSYLFVTTEDAASQALAYPHAIGYVPVYVDVKHMTIKNTPVLDVDDTLE
jgi:hypothetical protein